MRMSHPIGSHVFCNAELCGDLEVNLAYGQDTQPAYHGCCESNSREKQFKTAAITRSNVPLVLKAAEHPGPSALCTLYFMVLTGQPARLS